MRTERSSAADGKVQHTKPTNTSRSLVCVWSISLINCNCPDVWRIIVLMNIVVAYCVFKLFFFFIVFITPLTSCSKEQIFFCFLPHVGRTVGCVCSWKVGSIDTEKCLTHYVFLCVTEDNYWCHMQCRMEFSLWNWIKFSLWSQANLNWMAIPIPPSFSPPVSLTSDVSVRVLAQ